MGPISGVIRATGGHFNQHLPAFLHVQKERVGEGGCHRVLIVVHETPDPLEMQVEFVVGILDRYFEVPDPGVIGFGDVEIGEGEGIHFEIWDFGAEDDPGDNAGHGHYNHQKEQRRKNAAEESSACRLLSVVLGIVVVVVAIVISGGRGLGVGVGVVRGVIPWGRRVPWMWRWRIPHGWRVAMGVRRIPQGGGWGVDGRRVVSGGGRKRGRWVGGLGLGLEMLLIHG